MATSGDQWRPWCAKGWTSITIINLKGPTSSSHLHLKGHQPSSLEHGSNDTIWIHLVQLDGILLEPISPYSMTPSHWGTHWMLLDQPSPDPRTPASTQTGRRPNTVAHTFTGLTYLRDRKISQDMFLCKYMSIFYIHLHLCVSVYLYEYLCPYVYYIDASSCVCVSASTCINYLFKVILQRCPIDSCFKCLMRCS